MVIKAKEDFLSYRKGDIVLEEDYRENWSIHVEVEKDGKTQSETKAEEVVKKEVKVSKKKSFKKVD